MASGATVAIAWWVTGDWRIGLQVGWIELFVKMLLYYLHERFWYNFIHLGVRADLVE